MRSDSPIVLLTRPRVQSQEFRDRLGVCDVVISPILEIRPLPFSVDLDAYELLLFSSKNAVRIAGDSLNLAGKRAVAVGQKSANVATGLGMRAVTAGGDADALVATVNTMRPKGKVLFLRGKHSRGDVAQRLKCHGIETDSIVIYDQEAQELTQQARAVLSGERPVVIPLFSPRSAALVAKEVNSCGAVARLILIGMSDAVLQAWDGPSPDTEICAAKPTAEEMARETLRETSGWA